MKYLLILAAIFFLTVAPVYADMGLNTPMVRVVDQSEYVVNTPVTFELTDKQRATIQSLKGTTYEWETGDSTILTGSNATHIYKKPGTYTVNIFSKSDTARQLIETLEIHILPNAEYRRPIGKIAVNGGVVENGESQVDFQNEIALSAASSETGSSPISEYEWDFGDKTNGQGREVTHKYWTQHHNANVKLRVIDENGFSSVTSINIVNQSREEKITPQRFSSKVSPFIFLIPLVAAIGVILLARRFIARPR